MNLRIACSLGKLLQTRSLYLPSKRYFTHSSTLPLWSSIPWNDNKRERQLPLLRLNLPLKKPVIADDFKEYINNEIPSHFLDTSKLQFVSRRDVFRVFQDEIASVTEEQVQERIGGFHNDIRSTYKPLREAVLRQIIQDIVKYDVLSHRWDKIAGEPTYQDISTGKRHASEFEKIAQFCETSRRLGCKLAWIDTCCIDKTNATELSEAIHAMYKWYANSHLCIIHLAESTSFADWAHDSWFTRGWTLQELLAPKRVKFYDKNWKPFTPPETDDDRDFASVIPPLENATGIPKAVLTTDNTSGIPYGTTFWEIMSWASRRQTTRIEDRAYCLIGLFRISLTITYGEGQWAFSRLVEAIAAKNPSWDIFAWFGQPSADHLSFPSSPASYSRFEASLGKGRAGVEKFTITSHGVSLRSLPPIPMELSLVVEPEVREMPVVVTLKQRSDSESSLGRYGNLVMECGARRLKTIRHARQLSACILNHHIVGNREQGKLMAGEDYICFLLYSEDEGADELTWTKLTTDNLLRISCLGVPEMTESAIATRAPGTDRFALSLVTVSIQPPIP